MKLIVAGGRYYELDEVDCYILGKLHELYHITEIVSGGCAGADNGGETWAGYQQVPVKQFIPDWVGSGKSAGPLRNKEMAEYADALICFPGGKGTDDMFLKAWANNLKIWDFRGKKGIK